MNEAGGDMYSWVTHTVNPLGGVCPHGCSYCLTQKMTQPAVKAKYSGVPRLYEKELNNWGSGNTVFVCNMTDLFAQEIPDDMIEKILIHAHKFKNNTFVFQTKNPAGYSRNSVLIPYNVILGITIETNRQTPSKAPSPTDRARGLRFVEDIAKQTFVTIEPIIDFDLDQMVELMGIANPDFINIGADSFDTGLTEPTQEKVEALIDSLRSLGFDVRLKDNLFRRYPGLQKCGNNGKSDGIAEAKGLKNDGNIAEQPDKSAIGEKT